MRSSRVESPGPRGYVAHARRLFRWPSQAEWRRTLRLGLFLSLWAFGLVTAAGDTVRFVGDDLVGIDAHAYWLAGHSEHPYGRPPGSQDAFLYSPVFAQLMRPLALLPWPAFAALWMLAETAVFFWLTAPLPWRWRVPVLLACLPEVLLGNVYAYLALAAVLGLRRPEFWAFPLLTKITPGCLGLLWFVARGEWRHLVRALGMTLLLVATSYLLNPGLWREWVHFLITTRAVDETHILVRTAAAATLVVVAARLNKAWCLPISMWFAAPVFSASSKDLALLTGGIRLWRRPSND